MENQNRQQQAKALLQRRIEVQTNLNDKIRRKIITVLNQIAELGFDTNIKPQLFRISHINDTEKLQRILTDLRLWLYMNYTHSVATQAEETQSIYGTVPFNADDYMTTPQNGLTTRQRINKYTERLKYEAEAWLAASLLLGIGKDKLRTLFSQYAANPYTNPAFLEAVNLKSAAVRLKNKGAHFGKGQTVALTSLTRLGGWLVADSMRQCQSEAWNTPDIAGFIVNRGSSYPCQVCDDMRGFHRLAIDLPPYHANCCCWAYPVMKEE